MVEKLSDLGKEHPITITDFDKIKQQLDELQKPIYKQFFRYREVFGGVCDGIANYFGISIWWPRMIFSIPFITIFLYILELMLGSTIASTLLYFRVPLIFTAPVNDGYTFSPLTESILNSSSSLILIYILA